MGWVGRLQLRSVGRSTMIGPDTDDGALSDRIAHTLFTKIGWTEVGGGEVVWIVDFVGIESRQRSRKQAMRAQHKAMLQVL